MKLKAVIIVFSVMLPFTATAQNGVVTQAKNGGNISTIVQDGSGAGSSSKVEQAPGYVSIERRSGKNRATIIQMDQDPVDRAGKRANGAR